MNILVTGGAGFIGSHVVDALVKLGHEVIIIDNLSTGNFDNIHGGIFIKRSITDSLDDLFAKYNFDYVFHLAAQINLRHSIREPQQDALTNIVGSLNVLENCVRHKVKRVIFSSTGGAIYSVDAALPFTESSEAKPESPYGLAKLTIEKYLEMFRKIHGLQYTVLRYSNVYGPRQNAKGEAGVISIFINNALENKNLTIFGDGEQTRDFVYIDDVVSANMLAMESELDGIFNVSSNTQTSVNQVADKILNMLNSTSQVIHADAVPGEMLYTMLSADKLISKGWNSGWTIDAGIQSTLNFFKRA
jgi:UDP-glucose 4-epimerase